MKKLFFLALAGVSLLFFSSCEDTKRTQFEADSLATRLTVLEDSLTQSWKLLSDDDKNTIALSSQVLNEIEKLPKHNQPLLDSLKRLTTFLPTQYYAQNSLRETTLDHYDSLTTQLVSGLERLTTTVPGLDSTSQIWNELKQIQNLDQYIVLKRGHYQTFVNEYNRILKEKGDLIRRKKPDFKLPAPKPGFAIMQ